MSDFTLQGRSLYQGFPCISDFLLQGISLYKGFPFINGFPFKSSSELPEPTTVECPRGHEVLPDADLLAADGALAAEVQLTRDMGGVNAGRVKYMLCCIKCCFYSQLCITRALLL